jgi:hypothetical protein
MLNSPMLENLPVTDARLLRDVPFASREGWGVRYQIAANHGVVAVSLFREAKRLNRPLGLDEEMLRYFATEFVGDHRVSWRSLDMKSVATVGIVAAVEIPDSPPEHVAIVVEFAHAVPDSAREAPHVFFTDILRGLLFPDDLTAL